MLPHVRHCLCITGADLPRPLLPTTHRFANVTGMAQPKQYPTSSTVPLQNGPPAEWFMR